ncbi:MAG: hypothetical protein ABIE07_06390 [Candidatus Zixiibacteriota bacterium]
MFDISQAERIVIVGNGGSGKSTLASRLEEILQIPVLHLDKFFWQPGWRQPDPEWWRRKHNELISRERWIIDGSYSDTFLERLKRSEAVILLDFSTLCCLKNIIGRILRSYGQVRPDMAKGCAEKFDWEFIKWIWQFKSKNYPRIFSALSKCNMSDRCVILKNRKSVNLFIKSLQQIKKPA